MFTRIRTLFFLTLLLCGCRQLVQDDFPDFPHRLVINSILKVDEPVQLHISLTGSIDTSRLALVENATVDLYVNESHAERMSYEGDGRYVSTHMVLPGTEYRCEINIPGYETVSCSQFIPETTSFFDVIHINEAGKDEEGYAYPAITFSFRNDPATIRYYEVIIRLQEDGSERLGQIDHTTDPVLLKEGLPVTVFSSEGIEDSIYTLTLNYDTRSYGLRSRNGPLYMKLFPLILEFRSVSFDYYQYIRQRYLYETGRYPDFTAGVVPAASLYSNIENGYGIFAGYSLVETDTIYP